MAVASAPGSFATVTISDVVREAGVSRRTFYEHFSSKAECLIALYEQASAEALAFLRNAVNPKLSKPQQIDAAVRAYLGYLAQRPELLPTLFVDILSLGKPGLDARRRVNQRLGRTMIEMLTAREKRPSRITPVLATAIVGGIHELMVQSIENEDFEISSVTKAASTLILALDGV